MRFRLAPRSMTLDNLVIFSHSYFMVLVKQQCYIDYLRHWSPACQLRHTHSYNSCFLFWRPSWQNKDKSYQNHASSLQRILCSWSCQREPI